MKNIIILSLLIVSSTFCFTQNITFEPALPAPEFQKADVGAIDFADVDNDGDIDFMATGKGTPMQDPVLSTLYKNDGSGNFTEVLNTPFVDVFGGAIGFADIDNDNDLDLFITGNTHGGWRSAELYTNDGTGDYSIVTGTPFEPNWGGDFAFADMDGDGDQDLIMTGINQDDDALTKLYSNNGTGVFSEVTGTSFEQLGLGAVEFFDFDGDNDQDILLLGENDNDVSLIKLYANNGSGVFTEVTNTPFNNEKIGDVAIADTDNDGDLDVLISGEVGNSELYSNDGTGTFSLVTGTPIPGAIAGETDFADFDNDGDVDVLITGVGNGGIISNIYENLGGNNFILADSLAGAYLSSTAIGDINGDNLADVVIAGTSFTAPIRGTKTYLNITQTTVGFANEQSLQTVSIYPNPSSGIINIDCEQKVGSSIKVFNTIGELVYADDNLNPNRPIQLKQSPGLYMVIIKTNNLTSTHKLIFK